MSFDLCFVGPYASFLNQELGNGEKWIRDTVNDKTGVSLCVVYGYIPQQTVAEIAIKLKLVLQNNKSNKDFCRTCRLFAKAKKMKLAAQVSW